MSRRRLIRRARTSVLTFVFVSVLAYLVIPWLWTWSLASNALEDALQQAVRDTNRVGEEEAVKHELLSKWEQEEESLPRVCAPTSSEGWRTTRECWESQFSWASWAAD